MKRKSDWMALIFFLVVVGLLAGFLDKFIVATQAYPIPMGFLKVAVLATFGEYLKTRRQTGCWKISHPFQRFFVWGLFGILFTFVFPIFRVGVEWLIANGLWFSWAAAFSKSLWINMIFAWPMMLFHEYCNYCIEKQRPVNPVGFGENLDKKTWFRFIPLSIVLFWIPVHTLTFSLAPVFQVLCAAFLSVALGFILTFRRGGKNGKDNDS